MMCKPFSDVIFVGCSLYVFLVQARFFGHTGAKLSACELMLSASTCPSTTSRLLATASCQLHKSLLCWFFVHEYCLNVPTFDILPVALYTGNFLHRL